MKRASLCFATLLLSVLGLILYAPANFTTVLADRQTCTECQVKVNDRYEQCVAVHGLDYVRCSDDFNEGISHCFAHFCEIESGPEPAAR
jgi:hypothetical protein